MSPRPRDPQRERRLLQAAVERFARDGFRAASVRAICGDAGVNVAAVKYYFGSKAGLYQAAVMAASGELMTGLPMPRRADFPSAEAALRAWVRWGVAFTVTGGKTRRALTQIIMRELREPSPGFGAALRDGAGPIRDELLSILTELVWDAGAGLDPALLTNNVHAMCTQYEHSGEALRRWGFPRPATPERLDAVAASITELVLRAVRAPGPQAGARP